MAIAQGQVVVDQVYLNFALCHQGMRSFVAWGDALVDAAPEMAVTQLAVSAKNENHSAEAPAENNTEARSYPACQHPFHGHAHCGSKT